MEKRKIYQFDLEGKLIQSFESVTDASLKLGIDPITIRKYVALRRPFQSFYYYDSIIFPDEYLLREEDLSKLADKEIVKENVIYQKQKQKYQDTNRIERKAFREYARLENALIALNEQLIVKFDEVNFKIRIKYSQDLTKESYLIIQLSDLHFNELINLPFNKYDFLIAAKRLKKLANEVLKLNKAYQFSKILIAFTGDLLNSDRRLDEMLNQSTNRAKASLISVNLLQYFIVDIMHIAPLDLVMISGNESRVSDEMGYSDIMASDNYDYLIYNMLKMLFRKVPDVKFWDNESMERTFLFGSKNILIAHNINTKIDDQKGLQAIVGKYAARGIRIDFTMCGHIHGAGITDFVSRSSSLCGPNTYSEFGLQLAGKASQNLHIISGDNINNIRVDLHTTEGEGYPIEDDLDAYNAKSQSKLHQPKSILEIVI